MTVYIVTNVENGWDNICGVYKSVKEAIESQDIVYEEGKDNFDAYTEDKWSPYVVHTKELKLD